VDHVARVAVVYCTEELVNVPTHSGLLEASLLTLSEVLPQDHWFFIQEFPIRFYQQIQKPNKVSPF